MTEKEFNNSLIGQVQLSLATTKIAIDKVQDKNVKEFTGFELAETTVLVSTLKDLDILAPEMDEEAKALFTEIESGAPGIGFDKLYIKSQLKTHRLLRDLTEEYLNEAPTDKLDVEESQGKTLATLALVLFNEHVAITERIDQELANR